MSWRTVVISNRCKLDLKLGYMVVRSENEIKRIFLDEIAVLILENTAISITGCLLSALTEKKIKVVLCDERRNPASELVPYAGCHDSTAKIRTQIAWGTAIKAAIWTEIVGEKIRQQAAFLADAGKAGDAALLREYLADMEPGDITNREGHAAKVYFHSLFGIGFSRSDGESPINAALNYGYGLILSMVNREVSANGYLLQLGLFHDNMFNPFNLGCDIMEPLRVLVDRCVYPKKYTVFDTEQKRDILALLSMNVMAGGTNQTLPNAVRIYVKSVFNAINDGELSQIKFVHYEL